jgi:hypothetical protein
MMATSSQSVPSLQESAEGATLKALGFPHKMDDGAMLGEGYAIGYGNNPFSELLDEDDCDPQRCEWYMMQYSIGSKDDPTLLEPGSIRFCSSNRKITWSYVFDFIKTPVRASAFCLKTYMQIGGGGWWCGGSAHKY